MYFWTQPTMICTLTFNIVFLGFFENFVTHRQILFWVCSLLQSTIKRIFFHPTVWIIIICNVVTKAQLVKLKLMVQTNQGFKHAEVNRLQALHLIKASAARARAVLKIYSTDNHSQQESTSGVSAANTFTECSIENIFDLSTRSNRADVPLVI